MASPIRRDPGLLAEINVTSLVDVTIVLLIMFMIIAPISTGGMEVRVPKAESAPMPTQDAIVVSMDAEGRTFVERTEVRPESVGEVLAQIRTSRGISRVYVRADETVPYGRVARLMGRIREAEFETVGLVFDPPDPEER